MSADKRAYRRIGDKAKEGDYDLILPLDKLIVERLPDEGEMFAGLYPLGETVANLRKRYFDALTPDTLSARLRSLEAQGLVVASRAMGTGGNRIWQRTKTAKEVLLSKDGGNDS